MPKSLLDSQNELEIDFYTSVVGIYRQPEARNPEHVFLVTESLIESDTVCFCRHDLYIDENAQGNKQIFEIRSISEVADTDTNSARKALNTILKRKQHKGTCWQIHESQVEKLEEKIRYLNDNSDENTYNWLGIRQTWSKATESAGTEATVVQCTASLFSVPVKDAAALVHKGDNCLTWAVSMLKYIRIPESALPTKLSDLVAAIPSVSLTGDQGICEATARETKANCLIL